MQASFFGSVVIIGLLSGGMVPFVFWKLFEGLPIFFNLQYPPPLCPKHHDAIMMSMLYDHYVFTMMMSRQHDVTIMLAWHHAWTPDNALKHGQFWKSETALIVS